MDLIYTNSNKEEKGFLSKKYDIDIELGTYNSGAKNDFEITVATDILSKDIQEGSLIYEIGSEYGGIVTGFASDTSLNKATIIGTCWRGLLKNKVIEPPIGQAYFQARGEANSVIKELIDNQFEGLIVASNEDSGIEVYHDFRYTNLYESIEKMLEEKNARIDIKTRYVNGVVQAVISAVPINNLSEDIEFNNDYRINLIARKVKNGVNHVICLGKGELTERTVIHLFKLQNGIITTDSTNAIKGKEEKTIVYDYSSAENEEELINGGKKQFEENCDESSLNMTVNEAVEIGDIVGARERVTGIYMQKKVTQKVLKGYVDRVKIEYKVGD